MTRALFASLFALLLGCGSAEPKDEPPPAPKPKASASLLPTPAKIQSIINATDKDIATEEETALFQYASDTKAREIVLPELIAATKDPRPKVRMHVARAIELIADKAGVRDARLTDAITPLLEDKEFWVAVKAADALGRLKDPKAVPALIVVLERATEKDLERAEAAKQALEKITGKAFGRKAAPWRKWWAENGKTFKPL
jgi:HEAT repeat protein